MPCPKPNEEKRESIGDAIDSLFKFQSTTRTLYSDEFEK